MSYLLAIDAGNTRLKWAVHDGAGWEKKGAVPVADASLSERLQDEWRALPIFRAIVSNVAGDAVGEAIRLALQALAITPKIVVSLRKQCGVVNGYDVPEQLGSDRWAALIGAHATALPGGRAAAARLVIMAGTALTIDALSRDGEFFGGVILPGPALMRAALNHGTALLPAEQGQYEMFPRATIDAIAAGAVEACIGAIERIHARLSARDGAAAVCTLSGGASGLLGPHLKALSLPLNINENLVLDGLLAISVEKNSLGDA